MTKEKPGYVYLIESNGFYKIGKATNVHTRFKKYITENPHEVKLLHYSQFKKPLFMESLFHKLFKEWHFRGEWFQIPKGSVEYVIREIKAYSITQYDPYSKELDKLFETV